MSLINDALKRAKQSQQDTPLPELPGPQLRPVDPETYVRRGIGLALPIVLATVALLILLFVWQYSQRHATDSQKQQTGAAQQATQSGPPWTSTAVRARGPETTLPSAGTEPSKGSGARTPASDPRSTALSAAPDARSSVAPTNGPQLLAKAESNSVSTGTNGPDLAAVQPPKPAPPKLQGIVFNPRRPSAVINGRTLFIGDRFGEFRVRGITHDTVVLVGGGKTNVLSLEE
jgi:hypothetical protein